MGNKLSQHSSETTYSPTPPGLTETSRSANSGPGSPPHQKTVTKTVTSNTSYNAGWSVRSEATGSSNHSGGSGLRAASLHENLMRCQHRDPMEIYETVSMLGEGSMGCVCKVRKRPNAIGGSARPDFVHRTLSRKRDKEQGTCCIPFLGNLHRLMPRRESSIRIVAPECDLSAPPNPKRAPKHSSSSMISYTPNKKDIHFALKSIHLDRCTSSTLQKELLNEVAILRELDHAHIARAIETFEHESRLFICLELCSGGDLYTRDPYTEEESAEIVSGVLSAVSYLHSKGIIHRDLKFENIMFVDQRPDSEVKLIDFGLSQKFADDQAHSSDAVGTVYTMSPELIQGHYNSKADVWSIGVIAFMLLSSSLPFFGRSRFEVMKKICEGDPKFSTRRWKKISKYGRGIVRHLLEYDPTNRPSADRALKYVKKWQQDLRGNREENPAESDSPNSPQQSRQFRWKSSSSNSDEEGEMMDRIQASIQAFAQYTTLKKLALMVIAYKSTASEIGWLRSTFNRFDLLQNGEISLEEFTEALSEVYDYTPEELKALFNGMDVDGTGSVHYTEFLAATIEAHGSIDEDRIADAFDRIDCDDSGYITIQNLRNFLGDDVPHSYLEAIIDEADLLRDKRISYDEFLELWDTACYDSLRRTKHDVKDRRIKHADSLMMSFSEEGATSDETDDDEEEEGKEFLEPAVVERQVDPKGLLSPKTPVINNLQRPPCRDGCNATVFFSERKALSLRAGWM